MERRHVSGVSKGACALCGREAAKAQMTRHLLACTPEHDSGPGSQTLVQLLIEASGARLKSVFLSRGVRAESGVYDPERREEWLAQRPRPYQRLASWTCREIDELLPLREEAESWLRAEIKTHPIIRKLSTVPGMGPIRSAHVVAIAGTPERFRTRRQFWRYAGLGIITRTSAEWGRERGGDWCAPRKCRHGACHGADSRA